MDFIAFDLETTGLQPKTDAIVEIGAVRFSGTEPVKPFFSTLINPGRPIPPEATAINNITDDMVADKPGIETVLSELAEFCGDLPLVAHNAPFDFKFLLAVVEKHRARNPKGVILDTCALSRIIFPGMFNYKLGTLVRHFGFPNGTLHRVEDDCILCGRLFARIVEALENARQPASVHALLALAKQPLMKFPQYESRPEQLGLF